MMNNHGMLYKQFTRLGYLPMRSYDEYHKILSLWDTYENKSLIAELTGIPRPTVRDCIKKYGSVRELERQFEEDATRFGNTCILLDMLKGEIPPHHENLLERYAYLLGMYLGDGCISKMRRVYRLRISLDKKYPGIIQRCVETLEILMPNNKIGVADAPGCVQVGCCYKFWPEVFPQDGDGPKHKRKIALTDWQQAIVEQHPLEFLRGLYHSDGSRSQNIVNGKNYPRYLFTNSSQDIRQMFSDACELLGLHWTIASRRNICVSRRDDVAYLDSVIGPKC